jgi:hypothetical protein
MFNDMLAVAPPPPKRCNLILHCGAGAVSRDVLRSVETPRATQTWRPIPHDLVLQITTDALRHHGLDVVGEAHGITHDGLRYFGLLEVAPDSGDHLAHRVVGIRNSHDKRFSAGLVAGSQVLVCDNLSFSGEIALARKHTNRILVDLAENVANAVKRLGAFWKGHAHRTRNYQERGLSDQEAHHLMVCAVDAGVCAFSTLPRVVQHWREPEHDEFSSRNLWSLQNAFTEAFKGELHRLPDRCMRMHRLFDSYIGQDDALQLVDGEVVK